MKKEGEEKEMSDQRIKGGERKENRSALQKRK
jgi:hypothetical protein